MKERARMVCSLGHEIMLSMVITVMLAIPTVGRPETVEGEVMQWGCSGRVTNTTDLTPPVALVNVIGIAAGFDHNLALRSDGTVVAWGSPAGTPPPDLTEVIAIAAGREHSLALRRDGHVVAWGSQTGGGTYVPDGLSNVVAIAADRWESVVLRVDGTAAWWGSSWASPSPLGIPLISVAAGSGFAVGLQVDGHVIAWGRNRVGGETNVPPSLGNVVAVAAGVAHSLALRSDGTVVAWGWNVLGQTNVPPELTNVVAITAGENRSVAVRADGTVACWGEASDVPSGLEDIVAASAGTCLLGIRAGVRIGSVSSGEGQVILRFHTFSGREYAAQYSTALSPGEWFAVPGLVEGDGQIGELRDGTGGGEASRFYQLLEWSH